MIQYYEARVLFDYVPVTSDELCLRVGENVEVRVGGDGEEEGWLYGSDLSGRHGIFPASYVADLRSPTGAAHGSPSSNLGGGSAAPSYGQGDAEHAAGGGSATSVASYDQGNQVLGQTHREGLVPAAGGRRDGSVRTSYYHAQDAAASAHHAGTLQDRGCYASGTTTYHPEDHAGADAALVSPQQDPAIPHDANAPEGGGAASDDLPDGWFCATDPDSGVAYYYTADGQSSWTRPASTVVTGTVQPPPGGGEGNPTAWRNADSLSGASHGLGVSACLSVRCFDPCVCSRFERLWQTLLVESKRRVPQQVSRGSS